VSFFLKQEMLTKKLSSSQDIVDAINRQQSLSNEQRILNKKVPIQTIPLIHQYSNENKVKLKVIKNLKCFYHLYTNDEYKLHSTVYSDLNENSFFVKSRDKESRVPFVKSFNKEKIIEPINENLEKLWAKNSKIESIVKYKCVNQEQKYCFFLIIIIF